MAETLWPLRRRADTARFFAAYLAVAAAVGALWALIPELGLAAFLGYSVLHFSGDWDGEGPVLRVAGGLATIGAPALCRPDDVAALFGALAPMSSAAPIARAAAGAGLVAAGLAVVAVARAPRRRARAGLELAVLWTAAAALPPLLYFVAYFCALHAPRHVAETLPCLADRQRALRQMAGILALTLVASGAGFAALRLGGVEPDAAALQVVFIGLAALTVPHMVLVDRFRSSSQAMA
jgi:Brp/Blh family beta-carotene 15,15'-monooxygenase